MRACDTSRACRTIKSAAVCPYSIAPLAKQSGFLHELTTPPVYNLTGAQHAHEIASHKGVLPVALDVASLKANGHKKGYSALFGSTSKINLAQQSLN
jgi:hypothetical protein